MFDGLEESELLSWLLGPWRDDGPTICVVEGFNGIGKTSAAQKTRKAWSGPTVLVSATEDADLESLLFSIAAKLETGGHASVANQAEGDFRLGVLELLRSDSLIIIDEFDALLSPETRLPSRDLMDFVTDVGRLGGRGRLMLITAQSLPKGDWPENSKIKTMAPPGDHDATRLLRTLLRDRGLSGEVPDDRLSDIVRWLGRNPRAMQAFVACLKDAPLQELIDIDVEAWELRDQGATQQMVAHLESVFLHKTVERLDPPALLLHEFLSIYRTTFTIEVIKTSAQGGSRWEVAKDTLASRFLLGRTGTQYFLNPVARQLSLAKLVEKPRRRLAAHNMAADHYTKRVRPTSDRKQVSAGADFIEARYHLLQAGRESEFQDLAGDYRRLLLRNFRDLSSVPSHPVAANQLLVTLMGALHDLDAGYNRLRAILATLLVARGRPDDDQLAYRQIRIATRETRDSVSWLLRLDLTARLDTARAVLAVAEQALDALAPGIAVTIVANAAEALVARHEDSLALEAVNRGLAALPVAHRLRLYSTGAFLLCQQNRQNDAIALLLEGYRSSGAEIPNRWRLFEQALFIAFERRDRRTIRKIKELIIEQGKNEHQPVLCDVLDYELEENYLEAARLAEKHADYFAIAAQGAFCWLVEGQPDRATEIIDNARFQANRAHWWLRGVIAAFQGAEEVYLEAMARASGMVLSEEEVAAPDFWVRIWEEVPTWIGVFPAFYFPRLPAQLTGLPVDVELPRDGVSAAIMYPQHDFSLDAGSRGRRKPVSRNDEVMPR